MNIPSVGRIVHYTLTEGNAAEINARRASGASGNAVSAGETVPMIIVRVWNTDPGTINGQAFLDGDGSLWVTSCTPGESQGQYNWPARV